jgi:hypothetical protein
LETYRLCFISMPAYNATIKINNHARPPMNNQLARFPGLKSPQARPAAIKISRIEKDCDWKMMRAALHLGPDAIPNPTIPGSANMAPITLAVRGVNIQ